MKKVMLILLAVMFAASTAWAGNIPEFDAVGLDSANFFNDFIKQSVVDNVLDRNGFKINEYSDWTVDLPWRLKTEYFKNGSGSLYPDPCFPGYFSAMVDQYNSGWYEWIIVLQMKPESDIDLNIVDCVLKHNTFNPWGYADQTGRYRAPWGEFFFLPAANPTVTVTAYPGPYATLTPAGVAWAPVIMTARTLPGLRPYPLDRALYTSKALWEEGIVMVMPITGDVAPNGTYYNLKQGDYLKIRVEVPGTNTVDIFYGKDNVVLKYIGIVGTEYTTLQP